MVVWVTCLNTASSLSTYLHGRFDVERPAKWYWYCPLVVSSSYKSFSWSHLWIILCVWCLHTWKSRRISPSNGSNIYEPILERRRKRRKLRSHKYICKNTWNQLRFSWVHAKLRKINSRSFSSFAVPLNHVYLHFSKN